MPIMPKCTGCGKFLSPTGAAICSTCPYMFHRACVAIPDNAILKKDWSCPECKKKIRRGDNSATPVKGICDAAESLPALSAGLCLETAASSVDDQDIRAIRIELSECMAELRDFRNEFRASIASVAERMNGFEKRLEILESNAALSSSTTSSDEVMKLQHTVVQLRSDLNDRDQDSLLADLDIGNLPEEKGENVIHTVTILAAKLGMTLEERDIVFAERVGAVEPSVVDGGGARGRARRIVVRLTRRHTRDELIRAARVRRNLTSADIGMSAPSRRVFINERLTRNNRLLFHKVREECKNRQWRYAWTKRGRVYARQADGQPAYPIRSEADFVRVFAS